MLSALQQSIAFMYIVALATLTACVPGQNQTIQVIGPKPNEPINIPFGAKLAPIKLGSGLIN